MISYFIVALHVYNKLFEQTYKSQFQVIFGQDSFPPKISQFQVGQSFAELYKLSPCEWMREYLLLPFIFLHKSLPFLLTRAGFAVRYFSFAWSSVIILL